MENKYGFIYIWFDRKRKMFYIGCHWGTINDGYICSSNRMRDAYRRRPIDFKRRILKIVYERQSLHEEEFRWLSYIRDDELGVKYYNLRKHQWGHWSTDQDRRMSIGQKISAAPDRKRKISIANKGKKPADHTIQATIAIRLGKTYDDIYGHEKAKRVKEKQKKDRKPAFWSDEMRKIVGERSKTSMTGKKMSEETRKKMSESHKKRYEQKRLKNEKRI